MASKLWLLVEWVDEKKLGMICSYGVVNVDTRTFNETGLQPGEEIMISVRQQTPRRGKILKISESKKYIQEQRQILDSQNEKVKTILQVCSDAIKEVKSGTLETSRYSPIPKVLDVRNDYSDSSSSDSEDSPKVELNRFASTYTPQYEHQQSTSTQILGSSNASYLNDRSIISSTPLPSTSVQEIKNLRLEEGSQADRKMTEKLIVPADKMKKIAKLTNYVDRTLMKMEAQGQLNLIQSKLIGPNRIKKLDDVITLSDSESNNEASFIEPNVNEPQIEQNNPDYEENVIEEERQSNRGEQEATSSMNNAEPTSTSNTLHVRRMSAQTTNDIGDEVPIGNGHAMVPVTVLTTIDWKSYTNATRLLLQAVFPRRVLAKSSLTGRPSPAFAGKPAKNMLDPLLVEDIIITVTDNCEVPVKLVRNCITVKCADEARLYRNRKKSKKARRTEPYGAEADENEENISPSTSSSDE
ncbi:hypothetical protein PYW07_005253 [Mythimna separata]|uniref:BEN domain-containing protein n=1 Tax=Mythimna separata TaxID=271217 RepID=A0AAD7YEI7_MYTSE|nr:hypothetical protein PYW07_005253 [Mythimna separata]